MIDDIDYEPSDAYDRWLDARRDEEIAEQRRLEEGCAEDEETVESDAEEG